MLPLKNFSLATPKNLDELKSLLSSSDEKTKLIAGGTDLLPNLKHGLYDISCLISLKNIREFQDIIINPLSLELGAFVKLDELCEHKNIQELFPAISFAASHIASPNLRNMGTVGGNLCLDTRCCYFNQSEMWRKALNYCLKKDGDSCHVVKTGKRCVAASSNDLATILLAYNSVITIMSPEQEQDILLADFYTNNGEKNNILEPNQVVTRVKLTCQANTYAGFAKLRHRESIDFSLLSIGVVFSLDNNIFDQGRLVINSLVAKPKIIDLNIYNNKIYDQDLVNSIAKKAKEICHPQTNIYDDSEWRKDMIEYYTQKAFAQAYMSGNNLCC